MEQSSDNRGSGGSGRGHCGTRSNRGGGGGGRGGNYPRNQHHQQGQYQSGGGGRGVGRGRVPTQTGDQQRGNRPGQGGQGGGKYRPHQQSGQGVGPARVESSEGCVVGGRGGAGGGRGVWTARPSGPTFVPGQSQPQSLPAPVIPNIQSLEISEQKPPSTLLDGREKKLPIKRPDNGGKLAIRQVRLLVNHFPVSFDPKRMVFHYDVDIKPDMSPHNCSAKKSMSKSVLRLIKDKLFSDDPTRFPLNMTTYDGEKNIFSAVPLPTGNFKVELSRGEEMKSRSYILTVKLVNELKFSKLEDYLSGNLLCIPRDILQGMDLVMKENPCRHRISVGRSFYSKEFREQDDLWWGVAAFRGFQHSLKLTSQGTVLCLDSSVMALRKRLPVIEFLMEHFDVSDVRKLKREMMTSALKGLKVNVTHRNTTQKFIIAGLSSQNTGDLKFPLEDPEGKHPPREISLIEYFREKYRTEIMYKDVPCLDLGRGDRKNYVPMEFCTLVEGQRYPKEDLDRDTDWLLKKKSMPRPKERKNIICEMVQAEDGPCGDVAQNFGIVVDTAMTRGLGRVIEPPTLKVGNGNMIRVDREKCQYNLVGKSVVEGKPVERWALIDFSSFDRYNKLNSGVFIQNLRNRCRSLGIRMEEPVVHRSTDMHEFSGVNAIQELLASVVKEANGKCKGPLQIIVCVMTVKHPGKKDLKWVSEIQIGVLTQCCLSSTANNKGDDQYYANVALKINAKVGGSNVELIERLPCFESEEHVMLVGADVNHPGAWNATCPSIAAVVATMNPAANRYAARICPQEHRKEKILNFGSMCLDLINTYDRLNKTKPKKILIFRDGVSEGQFEMVLNEELLDIKKAICTEDYHPTITLVTVQKRHPTRLFLENERDGGASGNVPPGTVMDTTICHPFLFDFYLCSHYAILGTSKPTHYCVLWDEHKFTSDQLQKLTYHLCFTFARCTKPVSLVPPVYYADLVAFRGREYQEVAVELQSHASAASSSSGSPSSSSTSAASFDERFYKLHPDLENEMFFI
ncbi:unnamed protein product [Ilex paraguariensis]|uniref:Argonaute 2 n=1 Tax=Ilex paraguariensis TaxID=185542 RepID=A0ABC8UF58_9AQUA